MEDTWANRDLPVLEAIVGLCDETPGDWVLAQRIDERTNMSHAEVQQALFALSREHPPYFEPLDDSDFEGASIGGVRNPSGHARRTVGSWPSPEALADRLVVAMNRAADEEEDEERKGWLKKTAGFLGGAGRDLAVDVMGSAIRKQMSGM